MRRRACLFADLTAFLLNNGHEYHVAHLIGILEFVLEQAYVPRLRALKHTPLALGRVGHLKHPEAQQGHRHPVV